MPCRQLPDIVPEFMSRKQFMLMSRCGVGKSPIGKKAPVLLGQGARKITYVPGNTNKV